MSDRMDVSDLDGDFGNADGTASSDFTLPDGSYQGLVDGVEFKWSRTNQPERLFQWTFKVITGKYENFKCRKVALLRPDLLKWLKADIWKLGWQVQSLTELQENLGNLLDLKIEFKVVTKTVGDKAVQNVFITKLIEGHDMGGARKTASAPSRPARKQAEPPPPDDEDIPF